MRIAVDARMLGHSGIGRYLTELLRSWSADSRIQQIVAFGPPATGREPFMQARSFRIRYYAAPIYSVREQVVGPWVFARWRRSWDVLFFPHFNAPMFCPGPSVITIHDLIYLRYPEFFGHWRVAALRSLMWHVAKRATRIITGSESTKNDVVAILPELADRLHVVRYGVSAIFRMLPKHEVTPVLERMRQLRPYILFVGNFKAFKNLSTLVRAFARVSAEYPDLDLLLVGRPFPEHDSVRAIVRRENISPRVRELTGTSDPDLVSLFNGARAVVQPSLYEGFGLPVVEAMACGAPVVVSDTPALREVAGQAALVYGPPTDVEALAAALHKVLGNHALAGELRRRGSDRAAGFDSNTAAEATLEVLAEALAVQRCPRA